MIISDGKCDIEIKRRIAMAKDSFQKLGNILKDRKLSVQIKNKLLKCYVHSILLYGSECWTISPTMENRLKAAERGFYRKILRISRTEHVSNDEVLKRAKTERVDTPLLTSTKFIISSKNRSLDCLERKRAVPLALVSEQALRVPDRPSTRGREASVMDYFSVINGLSSTLNLTRELVSWSFKHLRLYMLSRQRTRKRMFIVVSQSSKHSMMFKLHIKVKLQTLI
ncbi:uncharacterized protein LOC134779724 [Penaeus indicus]|uniref:uncharacterized protein LOC134779724 n=1 Tax=Penaeus indicus TaxID=29960 RepID=UPI00300D78E4